VPRLRTGQQILDEARQLADEAESTFITDAVGLDWINQGIALLWGVLAGADALRHYATDTIATTAGTREYALPDDFQSLLAVDWIRGQERQPIRRFQFHERSFGMVPETFEGGAPAIRYSVQGQGLDGSAVRLYFDRDPGTHTYEIHYIQCPQLLASLAASYDGVAAWDEWVVYEVAKKMATRAENYELAAFLASTQVQIEQRILAQATERDSGEPAQIQDVRTVYSDGW
jgi:hypothetical protein